MRSKRDLRSVLPVLADMTETGDVVERCIDKS
jgi:hypothetical protein